MSSLCKEFVKMHISGLQLSIALLAQDRVKVWFLYFAKLFESSFLSNSSSYLGSRESTDTLLLCLQQSN